MQPHQVALSSAGSEESTQICGLSWLCHQAALVGNYNLTIDMLMRTVPEMQHMSGQCPCNVSDPTKVYISFLKAQAEALERLLASPMLEPCTLKGAICL